MRYDAVVFDNDGVLTTPTRMEAIENAIRSTLESIRGDAPAPDDVETLIRPSVDAIHSIAQRYDVAPSTLWMKRERAAIDAQYREIRSGEKRLYADVSSLDSLEVPRAIASNNQHETIENIVEYFELNGFDPWYGREPTLDGIRRKKPRPYYVKRAVDDLDVDNPLYVGDSLVDIIAADELGIDSAFIRRPHRVTYELDREPTYEIDSLETIEQLL